MGQGRPQGPRNDSTPLDNAYLKQLIVDYGAVYTSLYWSNSYYNSGQYAYYYNGAAWGNHAVAIVGWDDTFSRTRFVSPSPPGDGAWIVRNSWGSSWGESGYFYVSYYDTRFGEENGVFANAVAPGDVAVYQYDRLGWTGSYGYGTRTAWGAAVFAASAAGSLVAVGTYAVDSNTAYEIRIKASLTGTTLSSTTGTFTYAGYHVVTLTAPVSLTAGASFAVVVKYTASSSTYPIPAEDRITGYSDGATAGSGETYISWNGSNWSDLAADFPNSSVCIKAFVALSSPPAGGPVGYWRFNEGSGSTASDSSGSGNTGTISGAAWTTSVDASGALSFDGVDDYVRVLNASNLNPTIALTLEAWARFDTSGKDHTLIEKPYTSHTPPYYQYTLVASLRTGELRFDVTLNGQWTSVYSSGASLTTGTWYHVAGVYDGSSMRVYVNGVLKGSRSVTSAAISPYATNLYLGKHGNVSLEQLQGALDEVRIHNRALAPAEFNLLPLGAAASAEATSDGPVQILVRPNPVRSTPAILEASDPTVTTISIDIYDLSGKHVFASGWLAGRRLEWDLRNDEGELLANGVYLFIARVRDAEGMERLSAVGKLFLAR